MIREMDENDIEIVSKLISELYKKWDAIDSIDKIDQEWFGSEKQFDYLKKLLDDEKCRIMIYEEDGIIVSYLMASIQERKPFLKMVGDIAETFTLAEYRNKGIANKLVERAFTWFRDNDIEWFTVSTHSEDTGAISFWENRGFKEFNKNFKMQNHTK